MALCMYATPEQSWWKSDWPQPEAIRAIVLDDSLCLPHGLWPCACTPPRSRAGGSLIGHSPRRLGPSCWRTVCICRMDYGAGGSLTVPGESLVRQHTSNTLECSHRVPRCAVCVCAVCVCCCACACVCVCVCPSLFLCSSMVPCLWWSCVRPARKPMCAVHTHMPW